MNSLDNAKGGDKLLVQTRWEQRIATVERLTATLVIAGGYRFKKTTGSAVDRTHGTTSGPHRQPKKMSKPSGVQ